MTVLAQRGFRATIDEIAIAVGLSPRTVFRHYAGHDDLVADAVEGMFDQLGQPINELPDPAVDFPGWLACLARTAHIRNAGILGRAFWDIHNPAPDTSLVILEALSKRRERRRQWMTYIVNTAWGKAGGSGPAPQTLTEAFSLHFSAYATHALTADFDHSPEQAAALTTDILTRLLASAVAEQRG